MKTALTQNAARCRACAFLLEGLIDSEGQGFPELLGENSRQRLRVAAGTKGAADAKHSFVALDVVGS